MSKRVGIYLRVSTAEQTTENQRRELMTIAERSGWMSFACSRMQASGAKGREQRPGLDALIKAVHRREIDIVAAWSVDRLGRSLIELIHLLKDLEKIATLLSLMRRNITALPLHDAVLVAERHAPTAKATMERECKRRAGVAIPAEIKYAGG
jgi:DNA invertase Pin-like site-specific DNA recombinase